MDLVVVVYFDHLEALHVPVAEEDVVSFVGVGVYERDLLGAVEEDAGVVEGDYDELARPVESVRSQRDVAVVEGVYRVAHAVLCLERFEPEKEMRMYGTSRNPDSSFHKDFF